MRRRPAAPPAVHGRARRVPLVLVAAATSLGLLAFPAAAAPTAPLSAPVVTPSTTGPVAVGSPMTMTVTPGNAVDHPFGYAWTWGPAQPLPVSTTAPSCGSNQGGIHVVCGSSVTLRVSPESSPLDRFNVFALDRFGNASPRTTVDVIAIDDPTALYPVIHQWTTDQFGTVPAPARCAAGRETVDCVPDTAGVDPQHPNGIHPLLLPSGVTWDGSGGGFPGVPGVLTFGPGNRLPAATRAYVVDPRHSFAVGAMLTPGASPAGVPMTAIAQEGLGGTGFELGLTADGHWQFRVHTATGSAVAVIPQTALPGTPVYVAGVADAINREVRLYVDGSLATIARFTPGTGTAPDGVATVGGRLNRAGLTERWTGQVGNPMLAGAPLTSSDLTELMWESFFPGGDGGLN